MHTEHSINAFTFWAYFIAGGGEEAISYGDHRVLFRQPAFVTIFCPVGLPVSGLYVRREKKNHKHLSWTDCGPIELLSSQTSEQFLLICFTCKAGAFLFVQLCPHCAFLVTTFYINHSKTTNSICNVPGHRAGIYRRFQEGELEEKIHKLMLLEKKKKAR